jgi:hypothetical protein
VIPSAGLRFLVLALATLAGVLAIGCAPRPRMCTASSECAGGKDVACVAGRCQPDKPNVKPAIDASKRLIFRPVDLAVVRRGGRGETASEGGLPPSFILGRDGGTLFLKFSASISPTVSVVEAYVVLRRADAVDDDPAPLSLHATRIVEGWNGRSTSWARQPRLQEIRTPSTIVDPAGPNLVRLDVRDLVRQWPQRDPGDQGIAVIAENETRSGTTFALRAAGERSVEPLTGRPMDLRSSSAPDVEPYLELYVK